ncbi:hypothetical protein ACWC9T_38020 [Kitasatospora sp. NPDC001159]
MTDLTFDQADHLDQGRDAVVGLHEQRSHGERALEVVVAALDRPLALVVDQDQDQARARDQARDARDQDLGGVGLVGGQAGQRCVPAVNGALGDVTSAGTRPRGGGRR